ncbi:hypothetical protein ACFLZV_06540, partial [Candidatus Margulisiibacteriota bacterium]
SFVVSLFIGASKNQDEGKVYWSWSYNPLASTGGTEKSVSLITKLLKTKPQELINAGLIAKRIINNKKDYEKSIINPVTTSIRDKKLIDFAKNAEEKELQKAGSGLKMKRASKNQMSQN